MGTLFKFYQNILIKFPFGTQAVQTGFLMGCGDLISQAFVERKPLKEVDMVRTGKFTFIGTFFVGPPLRLWYGVLEKYFGNKGKMVALKKVTVDQLLFAPGFLAVIMAIIRVGQGKQINEIIESIKHDYPDVLKNNYKVWPAVQLCNFYMVPLKYQVVTVQFVAILWNTYLSWKINQSSFIRFSLLQDRQLTNRNLTDGFLVSLRWFITNVLAIIFRKVVAFLPLSSEILFREC